MNLGSTIMEMFGSNERMASVGVNPMRINTGEYVCLQGGAWVTRPVTRGVSVDAICLAVVEGGFPGRSGKAITKRLQTNKQIAKFQKRHETSIGRRFFDVGAAGASRPEYYKPSSFGRRSVAGSLASCLAHRSSPARADRELVFAELQVSFAALSRLWPQHRFSKTERGPVATGRRLGRPRGIRGPNRFGRFSFRVRQRPRYHFRLVAAPASAGESRARLPGGRAWGAGNRPEAQGVPHLGDPAAA